MGKLQPGKNDLKTWCENNGEWGKQLAEEFVGELEDGTPNRCYFFAFFLECQNAKILSILK